jgi:hypothetical protein
MKWNILAFPQGLKRFISNGYENPPLATIVMIVGSVVLPLIIVGTRGNVLLGALFLAVFVVLLLTIYRLDWGFYVWIGLVLISDNYAIPGFFSVTYAMHYLETLNASFVGMGIGVLAPIEVHALLIIFAFIVVAVVRKSIRMLRVPLGYVAGLFFSMLIVSLLYGTSRGGDSQMGLWEIRALLFFGLTFYLVRYVIRTREQLTAIMWVFVATIATKAFQAVERFIELGFDFGGKRALANHEDPVFMITLFIFLLGMVYFKYDHIQKRILLYLLPIFALAFYVANRRATYVSFGVCVVGFIALLTKEERQRITKGLVVFAVLFSIYLAAYWDSYGRMSVVAQAVKSAVFSGDRDLVRGEDYSSGLAREHENYNLAVTFQKSPIFGIGFGNKHEWAIRAYGAYALKGYITHNQILWLLTKTGGVGFFCFLFFLNLVVLQGAHTYGKLKDPYLRAACAMFVLAVLNQLVVSYVDMQLTYYRNMVYLGTMTGLIPTLGMLQDEAADTGAAQSEVV